MKFHGSGVFLSSNRCKDKIFTKVKRTTPVLWRQELFSDLYLRDWSGTGQLWTVGRIPGVWVDSCRLLRRKSCRWAGSDRSEGSGRGGCSGRIQCLQVVLGGNIYCLYVELGDSRLLLLNTTKDIGLTTFPSFQLGSRW